MRRCTLFLLLIISSLQVFSQEKFNFRSLDVRDGISDNFINGILRDEYGLMWFATINGLNRYDGYNFKLYTTTEQGEVDNDILSVNEDGAGNIWIKTTNKYFLYDRKKDRLSKDISSVLQLLKVQGDIKLLFIDADKNLWCIIKNTLYYYNYKEKSKLSFHLHLSDTVKWVECRQKQAYLLLSSGKLCKVNFETNSISEESSLSISSYASHKMYIDHSLNLWFYTPHSPEDALRCYYPRTKTWKNFAEENILFSDFVTAVLDDGKGNIWIGTDDAGIIIYNQEKKEFKQMKYEKNNLFSVSSNHIKCFYKDVQNVMWVGTSKRGVTFSYLDNIVFDRKELPGQDDISCILEDRFEQLWFGSDGEGITRVDKSNKNTHYNEKQGNLFSNLVVCSLLDSKNRIWFGTYGGGVWYYEKESFSKLNYIVEEGVENPLLYIRRIEEDISGNIWIGTVSHGLFCYDKNSSFTHYTTKNIGLPNNSITDLYCQNERELYIGTTTGLCVMDTYLRQLSPVVTETDSSLFADPLINCLYIDSRGLLWIGGQKGLSVLNIKEKSNTPIVIEDGLSSQYIRAITEDNNNNIWITTDQGISNIVVVKDPKYPTPVFRCYHYYEEDGLGDITFNNHSILKNNKGEILMGGMGGYVKAVPNKTFYSNTYIPKILFTDFTLIHEAAETNQSESIRHPYKDKNIQLLDKLTLSYSENSFILEISAMDYRFSQKALFSYRLEDSEEWIKLTGNKIYFQKLAPGEYTLQVKADYGFNNWNNTPATMTIVIKPPFWLSLPAYLIYFIFICGLLFMSIIRIKKKAKTAMHMQKLELEVVKQREMDEAKMRFLTNISHDLRTPLSLIILPLEKLLEDEFITNSKKELELIHRNAQLLLRQVNQLLDFKKLESGTNELNLTYGDIVKQIKETQNAFISYAEKKGIQINLVLNTNAIKMAFDQNKTQRIFLNLLSNALKFSKEKDIITISVDSVIMDEKPYALVQIADTGIGILDENKKRVFERFYHDSNSSADTGNGIGLHIVKEYTEMHNGQVSVMDNSPRGSVFTILLPIVNTTEGIVDNSSLVLTEKKDSKANKESCLLIVEDNDDFRQFLVNTLKDHYKIVSASNGEMALDIVSKQSVEMIISDVMMPVMDGMELCNKIKRDIRFSHIPVILLTARISEKYILDGLKEGADDYITKPFNLEILLLRIKKLLEWSKNNHAKFKTIDITPSEITISSLDEQLIEKAINIVEENMTNPSFSVEDLSNAVSMTRGHLYKKLMIITGKSPIEFIRILRVKRGRQLLQKSQLSVSEIAYKTGLSPKQFSKYFKEEYGVLPSDYKKNEKEKEGNNAEY